MTLVGGLVFLAWLIYMQAFFPAFSDPPPPMVGFQRDPVSQEITVVAPSDCVPDDAREIEISGLDQPWRLEAPNGAPIPEHLQIGIVPPGFTGETLSTPTFGAEVYASYDGMTHIRNYRGSARVDDIPSDGRIYVLGRARTPDEFERVAGTYCRFGGPAYVAYLGLAGLAVMIAGGIWQLVSRRKSRRPPPPSAHLDQVHV